MLRNKIPRDIEFNHDWKPTNYVYEKDKKNYLKACYILLGIISIEYLLFLRKVFINFRSIGVINFIALTFIIMPIFVFQCSKIFWGEGEKLREDRKFYYSCCQILLLTITFAIYLGPLKYLSTNIWQSLLRIVLGILVIPIVIGLVSGGVFLFFKEKQQIEEKPREVPKNWLP